MHHHVRKQKTTPPFLDANRRWRNGNEDDDEGDKKMATKMEIKLRHPTDQLRVSLFFQNEMIG